MDGLFDDSSIEARSLAAAIYHRQWQGMAKAVATVGGAAAVLRQLEAAMPRAVMPPDWEMGEWSVYSN